MSQIVHIIAGIGPLMFFAAAAIYIISLVFSSMRWNMLLPEKYPLWRLFSLYMIGSFFSSFLPGVVGGDAVRAYYLNKDSRKMSVSLASIFMDRYLGFVSLMLIGITAFPFSLSVFKDSPHKWLMPGFFVTFVICSVLFFGLQLGKRFRLMTDIYEYFSVIRKRKGIIIKAVLLSAFIQLLNFMCVILLAAKMGESISLVLLAVFLPIVITITSMPISISGIGVREGAFVVLLGLINISPEAATSLSLAWFLSIFMGSIPGLFFYMFRNRRAA
jgi:uncharacterized membrane protein YbhN (UPF0104 family)